MDFFSPTPEPVDPSDAWKSPAPEEFTPPPEVVINLQKRFNEFGFELTQVKDTNVFFSLLYVMHYIHVVQRLPNGTFHEYFVKPKPV